MLVDICAAFIVALIFNMYESLGKYFKKLMVLVSCLTFIGIFYVKGTINFVGDLDFSVWILLVIVFDVLVTGAKAVVCKCKKKR